MLVCFNLTIAQESQEWENMQALNLDKILNMTNTSTLHVLQKLSILIRQACLLLQLL